MAGTVLSGRYRLQEQIGSGGMGTVWRAEDTLLNREVAVKLLHPAQMAEPTSRERFRTEGRITAGLSHPGIAQVYDYGEQDGHAFLIMELVPGEPLSSILRRNDGLESSVTLDIVGQAAAALAAAHARGVVHRDIKPGNLLVTENGTVKLTDFGIARGNESVTLTQTGMVMGTAQYISPEQASGRPATHASDIYALGVVAYECLAGQPPFTSDTPLALALAHTREPPPPLPDSVPPQAAALVMRLLEKSPDARPQSAGEVAAATQALRSDLGAGATTAMDLPDPAHTMVAGAAASHTPDQFTPVAGGAMPPADGARGSDSVDSASPRRRVSVPLVLAAVAATALLVLGVVWAGRLWSMGGEPGSEGNKVGNLEPNQSQSSSPEPQPTVTEQETYEEDSGTEDYTPPDEETDYQPQPTQPATSAPPPGGGGDGGSTTEPTGGTGGSETEAPDGGETPPGGGDDDGGSETGGGGTDTGGTAGGGSTAGAGEG
nr:serine/threonine-protein kinase [Streptomonospora sp. PA3]